jgi:hypothetical protein
MLFGASTPGPDDPAPVLPRTRKDRVGQREKLAMVIHVLGEEEGRKERSKNQTN